MPVTTNDRSRRHRDRTAYLLATVASAVLVSMLSLAWQPRIDFGGGRGWDGRIYGDMADTLAAGRRPCGPAPYVFRIGTPLLAAVLSRSLGLQVNRSVVDQSFLILNLIAAVLSVVLLYYFLLPHVRPLTAWIACCLFMIPWHAPLRFVAFYPVYVDPWFFVFWIAGLLLISNPRMFSGIGVASLGVLTFVGVVFREAVMLVPLTLLLSTPIVGDLARRTLSCLLGVHPPRPEARSFGTGRGPAIAVALLCGIVGVALTRLIPTVAFSDYSFWYSTLSWIADTHLVGFTGALFLAYGPALLLLVIRWRDVAAKLRSDATYLSTLVLVVTLGMSGGSDTVRLLFWGAPVVLLLVAVCLEKIVTDWRSSARDRRTERWLWLWLGLMLICQLSSSLVFVRLNASIAPILGIPNRSLPFTSIMLTGHVLVAGILLLLFRMAERRRKSLELQDVH